MWFIDKQTEASGQTNVAVLPGFGADIIGHHIHSFQFWRLAVHSTSTC